WQANWAGREIAGCALDVAAESPRTVVDLTFSDPAREGTKDHQGFYAVTSVTVSGSDFDLDRVRGGEGPKGNVIKVQPIPAPKVTAVKPASGGNVLVSVELPEAVSYSEGGKDNPVKLISGYRILYASGEAPTSSDPAKYTA